MTCPLVKPETGYRTLSRLVKLRCLPSISTTSGLLAIVFRIIRVDEIETKQVSIVRDLAVSAFPAAVLGGLCDLRLCLSGSAKTLNRRVHGEQPQSPRRKS